MMGNDRKARAQTPAQISRHAGPFFSESTFESHTPQPQTRRTRGLRSAHARLALRSINNDWYKEPYLAFYLRHSLSLRGGKAHLPPTASPPGFMQQGGKSTAATSCVAPPQLGVRQQLQQTPCSRLRQQLSQELKTPYGSDQPLELVLQLNPYSKDSPAMVLPQTASTTSWGNSPAPQLSLKTSATFIASTGASSKALELSPSGLDFSLHENLRITPPSSYSRIHSGVSFEQRGNLHQASRRHGQHLQAAPQLHYAHMGHTRLHHRRRCGLSTCAHDTSASMAAGVATATSCRQPPSITVSKARAQR